MWRGGNYCSRGRLTGLWLDCGALLFDVRTDAINSGERHVRPGPKPPDELAIVHRAAAERGLCHLPRAQEVFDLRKELGLGIHAGYRNGTRPTCQR